VQHGLRVGPIAPLSRPHGPGPTGAHPISFFNLFLRAFSISNHNSQLPTKRPSLVGSQAWYHLKGWLRVRIGPRGICNFSSCCHNLGGIEDLESRRMPKRDFYKTRVGINKWARRLGSFESYVKAVLDQDLVEGTVSLAPPEAIFSRTPARTLFKAIWPASARRDMEALTEFQRALERFGTRAAQGDTGSFGHLLAMVNTAIAYLDKASVAQDGLARTFACDSLTWPVRCPSEPGQRQVVIDRLEKTLGVGGNFRQEGARAPKGRIGLVAYLIPRFMDLLYRVGPCDGEPDYAVKCREIGPIALLPLDAWWPLAKEILRESYPGLSKLEFREIDNIADYEVLEHDTVNKFIELVGRRLQRVGPPAARAGSGVEALQASSAGSPADQTNALSSIGAVPMPEMLQDAANEHFASDQILQPEALARKIIEHADSISLSLWASSTDEQREQLKAPVGDEAGRQTLRSRLRDMLNTLIRGDPIYDPQIFAQVPSPEMERLWKSLLAELGLRGEEYRGKLFDWDAVLSAFPARRSCYVALNRRLLEAFYYSELAKKQETAT